MESLIHLSGFLLATVFPNIVFTYDFSKCDGGNKHFLGSITLKYPFSHLIADRETKMPLKKNHPLPDEDGAVCIVKIYDEEKDFKVIIACS